MARSRKRLAFPMPPIIVAHFRFHSSRR